MEKAEGLDTVGFGMGCLASRHELVAWGIVGWQLAGEGYVHANGRAKEGKPCMLGLRA